MRSSTIRWPPASAIATAMAMPASRALATAVAAMVLAPSWVRRLLSATYIGLAPARDAATSPAIATKAGRTPSGAKCSGAAAFDRLPHGVEHGRRDFGQRAEDGIAALHRDEAVGDAVGGHRLLDEVRIVRRRL